MQWGIFVGPDNAKCLMLPVNILNRASDRVPACLSKIILYFQLQDHQYFILLFNNIFILVSLMSCELGYQQQF